MRGRRPGAPLVGAGGRRALAFARGGDREAPGPREARRPRPPPPPPLPLLAPAALHFFHSLWPSDSAGGRRVLGLSYRRALGFWKPTIGNTWSRSFCSAPRLRARPERAVEVGLVAEVWRQESSASADDDASALLLVWMCARSSSGDLTARTLSLSGALHLFAHGWCLIIAPQWRDTGTDLDAFFSMCFDVLC